MPYRFDRSRMANQNRDVILNTMGQTVTWWQFISATGGVDVAGIGPTTYSAGHTITAIVGVFPNALPRILQTQTPGGMIPAGETFITTPHKLGKDDQIIHNGAVYHVDSEPQYSIMSSAYVAMLRRG